jgi:Ni,Fe-hydrogenase III small subunit
MNWFLKGLKKGIKTENSAPSDVLWATRLEPGQAVNESAKAADRCPTQAIDEQGWKPERCIFCRLCEPDYQPTGDHRLTKVLRSERVFRRSFHVFPVDLGTCGACNTELKLISAPQLDMTRFGIFFTGSPRHADALLVMGVSNRMMEEPLRRAYEAMPSPKLVIALGTCAASGGIFKESGIRADVVVAGCPPSPYTILDALLKAKGEKGW